MTKLKEVEALEVGMPIQYYHNGVSKTLPACIPALIEDVFEDGSVLATAFHRGTSFEVRPVMDANENGIPYYKPVGIYISPNEALAIEKMIAKIEATAQATDTTKKAAPKKAAEKK